MQEEVQVSNIHSNWLNLITPLNYDISSKSEDENIQTFDIYPLEKGFGATLANSLRRVLLSSLRGTAICAIRIEGVDHEYSAINGVKEDVVDIILNLKEVVISGFLESGRKKITLMASKKGVVTAGMINVSDGFSIVNTDHVICTLSKDISLNIELIIDTDKGYKVAGDHKNIDNFSNFIPIDSLYSPVTNCSFSVQHARVGSETEYDKLSLTIETNGALKPDLALGIASKILQVQLGSFVNFKASETKVEQTSTQDEPKYNPNLFKKVADLELSVRSQNCLKNSDMVYLGDLVSRTESQMLKMANFGKKSLDEIRGVLQENDLDFGMKELKDWPPENIEELAKEVERKI